MKEQVNQKHSELKWRLSKESEIEENTISEMSMK